MTDFEKLTTFAELLGVKVKLKPGGLKDAEAAFVWSPPQIEIFSEDSRAGDYVALILLHECGHAMDWAELGRIDGPNVFSLEEKEMTAEDRELLWRYEKRAIYNMKYIYNLLNLQLPMWKLERERQFDLWVYRIFRITGAYPTKKQRMKERARLKRKLLHSNS